MKSYAFWCIFLVSSCDCNDVFHDGSKTTFHPDFLEAGLFGYAVAFSNTGLIVGAPNATIRGTSKNSGVVFNCPIQNLETRNVTCTPLKGVNMASKEFHNGMWFGASLAVGPTGKTLICAPRWLSDTTTFSLNGLCYLQMERRNIFLKPLSVKTKQKYPIGNSNKDYVNYHLNETLTHILYHASGQAGMATKMSEDTIIIGAPGLLVWSGGIVQYNYNPNPNSVVFTLKPTYNPYYTQDVSPEEYYGYSVESGIFEDGGSILYVAGGPKAKQGFGMVLVLKPATSETASLNILAKLKGPHLGSYFGASLRCLDVNADGRTDILVGAPNFVKSFKDDLFDQGAVFVYLNKEQETGFNLEYVGQVSGSEANGAKFGDSIAELGDVDGDGYNDVAISAPWEDNGIGAVYIYGGDKYGLKAEYVQRIVAAGARGFGTGLTRGYDVDKNNCNDLVVGAHESNSAYIYRCIPTVKIQVHIEVPRTLSLAQNITNFTAQFCVTMLPLREYSTGVTMEFQAKITVDPQGKRAAIAGDTVFSYTASTSHLDTCVEKIVEIKPAADLSRPITITFDLEPIDRMRGNPTQFLRDAGRVSKDSNLQATMVIQLVNDCGKDLICTPWLEMTLEAMNDPYIPGSEGRLGAVVTVLNKEEPAFGMRINLTLPSPPKRVPSTCVSQGLNLICNLPSPFNRNQTAVWEVELEYTQDMGEMGITMINADVDDLVSNQVVSDNATKYLGINITPLTDITAIGKVFPNATVSVSREVFNEERNVSFVHYFQVSNAGPSDCPDFSARILIPSKVSLMREIAGCEEIWDSDSLTMLCSWSVRATQSLSVSLPLHYDLSVNGKSLELDGECNITSILFLENVNVTLTTRLVLEPAPPIWIAIVVAAALGLVLLAAITYMFHKRGFFSRARHYKVLNQQETVEEQLETEPGASCLQNRQSELAQERHESTKLDHSNISSETTNSLPPVTFQGPSNESNFSEAACSSPVTLTGSTALYTSLRKQLETDPDLVD